MKTFVKFSVAALAAGAVATAALAASHGGDLPASVKARKAQMALHGFNVGLLAGMAQGKIEYDAAAASAAASNLAALSKIDTTRYWEPGTDSDSLEGSRALPAIWQNLDDVVAKYDAFGEAATALAATAGDGLDALKAGLGPVGEACGACHKAYQLPNN